MIDWMAILMSILFAFIILFFGFMLLEYPFIREKEKTWLKTFVNWYKKLK